MFGSKLVNISDSTGMRSKTPWKCVDAERFATDAAISPDSNQLCEVQMNSTGGKNIAFVIIGLDANGKGLNNWTGDPQAPKPSLANNGAVRTIQSGPPDVTATVIDEAAVIQAMKAVKAQFKSPKREVNACLLNMRTARWIDIQAHYYCLYPVKTIRLCYSSKLAETRDPALAFATCFATNMTGNPVSEPGGRSWTPQENQQYVADVAWFSTATNSEAFKYIMFVSAGTKDFDIESQNATINSFYGSVSARPRRGIDTYPAWLPDQPRYEDLRKLQSATQANNP